MWHQKLGVEAWRGDLRRLLQVWASARGSQCACEDVAPSSSNLKAGTLDLGP